MPKILKPLTNMEIQKAKPKNKVYYLRDGDGLALQINPSGSKIWLLYYTHPIKKKRTTYTIGHYPHISLKEARAEKNRLKELIRQKKELQPKKSKTFGHVADKYFSKLSVEFSDTYLRKEKSRYQRYLSQLEHADIEELNKDTFISIAQKIQQMGHLEQGKRVFNLAKRILDFAVANDYMENNFLSNLPLRLILKTPKAKNYAHITDPKEFGILLNAIEEYDGSFFTKHALNLLALTFVRPANIRQMEWSEIDFEERLWKIPAEKMKMNNPHIVPLSEQAIEILKDLKLFEKSRYVFYAATSTQKAMSENTLNQALMRLGYKGKMTSHGFRHTASTLLHENIHKHGVSSEVIELQLAHTDRNHIRAVYNKAQFLEQRIKLMQWWAYYLDELKVSIF